MHYAGRRSSSTTAKGAGNAARACYRVALDTNVLGLEKQVENPTPDRRGF